MLLAITTRPNTPALALAIGVAALGWVALRRARVGRLTSAAGAGG